MPEVSSVIVAGSGNGVRNLSNLEDSASTARVLNLLAVARESEGEADYRKQPFFLTRALNTALILKHRLRRDEAYMVQGLGQITTKIIFPLNRGELGLGGQSLLVGQRGWKDTLREICGSNEAAYLRDAHVLEILNELPSLDPFLLREHLKRRGVDVAACYFAISNADVEKMRAFVASEVVQLILLAYGGMASDELNQTARLVTTLLSTRIDSKLEPLRLTFGMDEAAFTEGVFSWKGFLYYKWSMDDLRPRLADTLAEIGRLEIVEPCDADTAHSIERSRRRLRRELAQQHQMVIAALGVYNAAFRDLTLNGNPRAFREFLINAPEMFISLGDKMGAIAHIVSFWRYRFAKGAKLKATGPDAFDLLRDFEVGLGSSEDAAAPHVTLEVRTPPKAAAG